MESGHVAVEEGIAPYVHAQNRRLPREREASLLPPGRPLRHGASGQARPQGTCLGKGVTIGAGTGSYQVRGATLDDPPLDGVSRLHTCNIVLMVKTVHNNYNIIHLLNI